MRMACRSSNLKNFPSTSLVQCHLKYPIVTATDVEQDIVSFD